MGEGTRGLNSLFCQRNLCVYWFWGNLLVLNTCQKQPMEERFPGYRNDPWRKGFLQDTLCGARAAHQSHTSSHLKAQDTAEPKQGAKVVRKTWLLLITFYILPSRSEEKCNIDKCMWPVSLQPSLSKGNNANTIKWQPRAKYTEIKAGCCCLIPVTFSSSGFITPQNCSAEPLFCACFLMNFTVNLSFSDQSDL